MPRILIADDNSNIQRMAALALKDAGIEVIAVGNGEAAVRKMPEVMPDLVLADIFMPVRNGYEVCEFIKHDPRYANVPVLLLAGAFDPFDEQEAQRVHADGVLKKPFVPPDPLINAVRTLLAKSAGDRLMAVTVPAAAEASAESGKAASVAPRVLEPLPELPPYEAPEEFALPLTRDDLGASEKAAAFAQAPAPQSPVAELDDPETVVTASRDPSLGEPAFWVPEESGDAEEAEEATSDDQDLTDHTWGSEGRPAPLRDDPLPVEEAVPATGLLSADIDISEPVSPDLVQDMIPPAVKTAPPARTVLQAQSVPAAPPASDSSLSKARPAEDTVPLPETWVDSAELELEPLESSLLSESATSPLPAAAPTTLPPALAPPLPAPSLSEVPPIAAVPVSAVSESKPAPKEHEIPTLKPPASHTQWSDLLQATQEPQLEPAPVEQVAKPEPEAKSQELVTESEPVSKPEPVVVPEQEARSQEPVAKPEPVAIEAAPRKPDAEPEFTVAWPPAFIPAVSAAVNEVRASALQIVPAAHASSDSAGPGAIAGPLATLNPADAPLGPEAVEAAIQRVMERMQPQIIELVTRDILRPLVEALVQQELKK